MIQVRRARRSDVRGIASVAKGVWGQDILTDTCEAQIEGNASALWVATEEADDRQPDGTVIGFCSAFLTVGARDHRRWELDLVAVRQDNQGQGVGTQLISQVCEAGESHGVSLARALIRVENIASQRAFEKAGFTTDGQLHHLLLWTPEPGAVSMPRAEGIALLPVETLTYRGLWIEGLEKVTVSEQRSVVRAARAIIAREGRLKTGSVIPIDKEHRLAPDVRNQGRMHDEYLWFIKASGITRNVKHKAQHGSHT